MVLCPTSTQVDVNIYHFSPWIFRKFRIILMPTSIFGFDRASIESKLSVRLRYHLKFSRIFLELGRPNLLVLKSSKIFRGAGLAMGCSFFDKGHPFLKLAMEMLSTRISGGADGPGYLTKAWKEWTKRKEYFRYVSIEKFSLNLFTFFSNSRYPVTAIAPDKFYSLAFPYFQALYRGQFTGPVSKFVPVWFWARNVFSLKRSFGNVHSKLILGDIVLTHWWFLWSW